jgi:hypothetical protein
MIPWGERDPDAQNRFRSRTRVSSWREARRSTCVVRWALRFLINENPVVMAKLLGCSDVETGPGRVRPSWRPAIRGTSGWLHDVARPGMQAVVDDSAGGVARYSTGAMPA